ncbi:alpha carbonic anhydrase [Entophlyctis helioformis]|nr:alpha carbonic anhydrase [Entophlyctis helioformis]
MLAVSLATTAAALAVLLGTAASVSAHANCLADVIVRPEHQHHLHRASGAAFWAALDPAYTTCALGTHQSPINFDDTALTRNPAAPAVVARRPAGQRVARQHGPHAHDDTTAYALKQLHFHAPAEHHRRGRSYALEAHFVHVAETGAIAVLGVWFDVVEGLGSPFLESIVAGGLPAVGASQPVSVGLDEVARWATNATAWSYEGSLTTPPFVDAPLPISVRQLKAFVTAMPFNARATAAIGTHNSMFGHRPELFAPAGYASSVTATAHVTAHAAASKTVVLRGSTTVWSMATETAAASFD